MLKKSAVNRRSCFSLNAEVLDEGEIPVLLEWSSIDIPMKRTKARSAGRTRRIGVTSSLIGRRRGLEVVYIDIGVEPLMDVAVSQTGCNRATRRQISTQRSKGKERSQVCRASSRIQNREGRTRLKDCHTADRPIAQEHTLCALGILEDRKVIVVTNAQPMLAIKV